MPGEPTTASTPLNGFDVWLGAAIFLVALGVFLLSPVSMVGDSKFSLLVTQSLVKKGTFAVDGYGIPPRPILLDNDAHLNGDIYQIEVLDGHFYGYFPPGTAVLSAPFVLVAAALGYGVTAPDGTYSYQREVRLQRLLAGGLMAALTAIFYATARLLLPPVWSALISLGAALGTQVYSTASRALWAHTWGLALLGLTLFLLLALETGRWRLRPVLLATVLSWTYFVRPTNSLFIVGATLYFLFYHRAAFLPYAATGAAWFTGFVVYSWVHYGKCLPSYYGAGRLQTTQFREAFMGNLVSPSRGVLVYVPVTLFVLYLLARFRRRQPLPRLVWLTLAVVGGHLLTVSCFVPWHGGGCYGPRYTTELVPWFVLLAILGTRAALNWHDTPDPSRRSWTWAATLVTGGGLLLVSVAINARGACSPATEDWNRQPVSVDVKSPRVWDWRYPQILAGLIDPPLPATLPSFGGGRATFGGDAGRDFLLVGWSPGEADVCWSEAKRATLVFSTDHLDAAALRLCFGAYIHGRGARRQKIAVSLNGKPVARFNVHEPQPREYTLSLPKGALRRRNLLAFDLPEAVSPLSVGDGQDDRRLGINLRWLELAGAHGVPVMTPAPSDTSARR